MCATPQAKASQKKLAGAVDMLVKDQGEALDLLEEVRAGPRRRALDTTLRAARPSVVSLQPSAKNRVDTLHELHGALQKR